MPARPLHYCALVLFLTSALPTVGAGAPPTASDAPPPAFDHVARAPFADEADCLRLADAPTAEARHLCERLLSAWANATGAHAGPDNPLKLDFAGGSAGRGIGRPAAILSAAFLGRLLSIPHLLPPRLDGGVVLENVTVEGTLDLIDAEIGVPVTFRRVWLSPRTLAFGEDGLQALAIDARRAAFSESLSFIDATVLGHVRIADSRFARGLTFESTVLSTRLADGGGTLQPGFTSGAPAIQIRGTAIEAGLAIEDSQIFGTSTSFLVEDSTVGTRVRLLRNYMEHDVRIGRSAIGSLSIRDGDFAGDLILDQNRLDRLEIANSTFSGNLIVEHNRAGGIEIMLSGLRDTPYVNYNLIEGNLDVIGITLQLSPEDGHPEFAANEIGGRLWFMPDSLDQVRRIDLTLNNVARLATIYPPPENWAGMLDLSNSKVGDRLKLGDFDRYINRLGDRAEPVDAQNEAGLPPPYAPNEELGGCSGIQPSLLINLTNVETDVLAWNFPLSCAVQWDGAGLHYRYWGDPDLKPVEFANPEEAVDSSGMARAAEPTEQEADVDRSEREFGAAFMDWRHVLYQASSGPLSVMADYMHTRGNFSGSRELLMDAKAADYAGKWLVYYMLLPTGFGAKPELALLWLFLGWLLGIGAYQLYRRRAAGAGWPPPHSQAALEQSELAEAMPVYQTERASLADTPSRSEAHAAAEQPSLVPGFMQYQRDKRPADFSLAVFSADALLPVINLHAYTEYYPRSHALRILTFAQHVAGWYLLTIFLASATVL